MRPYRRTRDLTFYFGAVVALGGLVLVGAGAFGRGSPRRPQPGSSPSPIVHEGPRATLRVVSVAVDGRQRHAVQSALAQLSTAFDLSTATGMARCAQAISRRLLDAAEAVRYAEIRHEIVPLDAAQSEFDAMADALRSRYVVETVHATGRIHGPAMQARSEEGEGFVVVSLIAGFDGVFPLSEVGLRDWQAALHVLAPSRAVEQWVALQVVWSPTDENDRMSSAELEVLYPELRRLDDGVGRMVCAHCGSVGAKELGRCPACGAPYPGVEKPRSEARRA